MSFASFDVRDYGADPSGKTDSYQAFLFGLAIAVSPLIIKAIIFDWLGLAIISTGAEYDEHAIALRLNLKTAISSVLLEWAIAVYRQCDRI
jgi:hypothetical protein